MHNSKLIQQSVFKFECVLICGFVHMQIVVWDSLTGDIVSRIPSNHVGAPRWLEHSPSEAAFVSCGSDRSVRFWREAF